MENYTSGGSSNSTNFSLTPEQIEREEFEEDFQVFMKFVTRQDLAKIYKCIGILLLEKRIEAEVESSASGTPELPLQRGFENQKSWSFIMENAGKFSWFAANPPLPWFQGDAQKINRVILNAQQVEMLKKAFSSSPYISGKKRRALAERLGLKESQVTRWFDNRRHRLRQEQLKTIENENSAVFARRQVDQVHAHVAVKQESSDTGYARTSNLPTEDDISGEQYSLVATVKSENTSPNSNSAPENFSWQED